MSRQGKHSQVKYKEVSTASAEQTSQLAGALAPFLTPGCVLTLHGNLGVGKTTFTRGLAQRLGVQQNVNSPTFTLIKEYEGTKLPLYHMDAYRIDDELEMLGLEEYFYGDGVCVIEWPDRIAEQLPAEQLQIRLTSMGEHGRHVQVMPRGEKYVQIVAQWLAEQPWIWPDKE